MTSLIRTPIHRCVRHVAVVALVLTNLAMPAFAREQGMGFERPREMMNRQRGEQMMQRPEERRAQRAQQTNAERQPMQQREERPAGAPPNAAPPQGQPTEGGRGGRPGRLSPEERRALRQQINDAGRNVYRPPPP